MAHKPKPITLLCPDCGRETEYPRDPGLEVACPACRAPVGSWCRRPSEHVVKMANLHRARLQAAHDQGFEPACPCRAEVKTPPAPTVSPIQLGLFHGGGL